MIELDIPELQMHEFSLLAEEKQLKAASPGNRGISRQLTERVSLGQPVCQPLTKAIVGEDKHLLEFIKKSSADYNFHLIHLACTFHQGEDDPFQQAWLIMNLSREDNLPAPVPITWSMTPLRVPKEFKVSNKVKLGGSLKFMDQGIEIEKEKGKEYTLDKNFIQAFGELEEKAYWEFSRIEGTEIRGSYRFSMVAQTPKGVRCRGTVTAEAVVKRKLMGITYRTDYVDAPKKLFVEIA